MSAGTRREPRTVVYTDGACLGNPGPGGWAWAVPGGPYRSGAEPETTNQRMEITAVLDAARHLDGPLDVVSDSAYVVNCWRDRWWEAWLANGWRTSQKRPVANRDLWEPLVAEFRAGRIRMRWVKGHAGDPMNDLVDRLAVEAAMTQRGRSGTGTPTVAGPADLPGGAPGASNRGGRRGAGPTQGAGRRDGPGRAPSVPHPLDPGAGRQQAAGRPEQATAPGHSAASARQGGPGQPSAPGHSPGLLQPGMLPARPGPSGLPGRAGPPTSPEWRPGPGAGSRDEAARDGTGPDDRTDPPEARLPGGHRVVIGGLRPAALGGYDHDNPTAVSVRRRLTEVLAALREHHPDLVVLTGLGLGAEQLGAEAAREAGVPYVVVLAYPAQDAPWPVAAKRRYARLLANAATTIPLRADPPASRQQAGAALRRRDGWLARHADQAVVVWDGRDEAVGRLVGLLRDELGGENVWVIEPPTG